MKFRTSLIGLLVVCAIGVCSIGTAAAQPAAPPAGYKIEEKYTQKSPDGAITIEQYLNKDTDDWKWQSWVRRQGAFTLLDPELADYPAGFRFTNDLKWLVRMQKTVVLPLSDERRRSTRQAVPEIAQSLACRGLRPAVPCAGGRAE